LNSAPSLMDVRLATSPDYSRVITS
jgi:hypothetical protein